MGSSLRRWGVRIAVLAILGFSSPAVAQGNGLRSVHVEKRGTQHVLVVTGRQELGAPRVVSERGRLRFWFMDTPVNTQIDQAGDGEVVRSIRVRPGMDSSTLVQVQLVRPWKIPEDKLSMQVREHEAVIALPLPQGQSAVEESPSVTPAETPRPEENRTKLTRADEPAGIFARVEKGAKKTPAPAQKLKSEALGTRHEGYAAQLGLLLVFALLLGGVYLLLLYLKRARGGSAKAMDIEIIASKRLAPKHQLLVVRALGKDHLISIQGGETKKLASAPVRDEHVARRQEDNSVIFRTLLAEEEKTIPPPATVQDEAQREDARKASLFGGLYASLARESSMPAANESLKLESAPKRANVSGSVSGLIRLRELQGLGK